MPIGARSPALAINNEKQLRVTSRMFADAATWLEVDAVDVGFALTSSDADVGDRDAVKDLNRTGMVAREVDNLHRVLSGR